MVYRTFGDLRTQVEAELDTQDEEFCSELEMQSYFNSAVTLCEATIVKLGLREKYLQADQAIDVVKNQVEYDLPTDCVINKIRKIIYRNRNIVYTLKPLRGEDAYIIEDALNTNRATDQWYRYQLYKSGNIQKIRLAPLPLISVTGALRVIYFKSLNRYTTDLDLCDLPEICYEYLLSYVRYRIYAKETHTNTPDEKANMQALLQLMEETLQNQVADPEMDRMDADFSHYEEMI